MKCFLMFALIVVLLAAATAAWDTKLSYAAPPIDAKIEAVWPHIRQESSLLWFSLANVEVYLFDRGTLNPVPLNFSNKVTLRWSLNFSGALIPSHHSFPWLFARTMPEGVVGERIVRNVDGKTFPAWVFNDVPVRADFEGIPSYFFVEVEGADVRSNVWAHASDSRTIMPTPIKPTSVGSAEATSVDGFIQIVWPHDVTGNNRPVEEADQVNVAVDLFQHPVTLGSPKGTAVSISPGFNRTVRLLRSTNQGVLEPVKAADEITTITSEQYPGGPVISWPRWVFNDVDVSAAKDPLNKYYFAIQVDGVETHATIWAHGADARTYFPQKDVPARSATN